MGQKAIEIEEMVGAFPACSECNSRDVVRNAWAEWNGSKQAWALQKLFDDFACSSCGEVMVPVWKLDQAFRKQRIVRLNDSFRRGQIGNGTVVITSGLMEMGEDFLAKAGEAVALFDQFSENNDPHREHDFGAINIDGNKLFWKLDYFDLDLQWHSPDAANPDVTHRVLTIMLASEY